MCIGIRHRRHCCAAVVLLATTLAYPSPARAQPPVPRPAGGTQLPVTEDAEPIDLASAMRLALSNSLEITHARAVVAQAQARRQQALVQWLPNLNLGVGYLTHEGRIQQVNGNILTINRDSLFVGGGPSLALSPSH